MAESGLRQLPSESLTLLSELVLEVDRLSAESQPAAVDAERLKAATAISAWSFLAARQQTELAEAVRANAARCLRRAEQLEKKLDQKLDALLLSKKAARLIDALAQRYPTPTARQTKLFERLRLINEIRGKRGRTPALLALLKLRWKIDALRREADAATRFIDGG
jgi:hypothetical protein